MALSAEKPLIRPSPEITLERNTNHAVGEAIIERWTNQRYEACTERWEGMIGRFPETIRAFSIVPVSLNDEPLFNIERLMDRYGEQTMPPDQWGALLSLNYTGDLDEDKAMAMLDTIDQARLKYPMLNVATCIIGYDEPQPISRIRSDIWDVAQFDIYAKNITYEVTGISHDADIWKMPPDHIRRWAEVVDADPRFCYGGYYGYDTIGSEDLPANKYLLFLNYIAGLYAQMGLIRFEGNMALSINKYAASDDWGEAALAEALTLLENFNFMKDGRPSDKKDFDSILRWYKVSDEEAVGVEASPRRVLYSFLNRNMLNYDNFTLGNDKERGASIEDLHKLITQIPPDQVRDAAFKASRIMMATIDAHDINTVHELYRLLDGKKRDVGVYDKDFLVYVP